MQNCDFQISAQVLLSPTGTKGPERPQFSILFPSAISCASGHGIQSPSPKVADHPGPMLVQRSPVMHKGGLLSSLYPEKRNPLDMFTAHLLHFLPTQYKEAMHLTQGCGIHYRCHAKHSYRDCWPLGKAEMLTSHSKGEVTHYTYSCFTCH